MGNKLYLECTSGISGDMLVAALIDLGVDQHMLNEALASIPVSGFSVEISRVKKSALDVCDFHVRLSEEYENHDHDMNYLHNMQSYEHSHTHEHEGHDHSHTHEHEGHDHSCSHEHEGHNHSHSHEHESHAHIHRGMKEVSEIINQSGITNRAKTLALRIFEILGRAEAKAHGTTLEEVHFHEVGAVDSIVDIIAAAVCLDSLAVDDVIIPVLAEGRGTIRCQHGILPVPVPAVANIVSEHGLKLQITDCQGELVTPTGAAIAAAVRTKEVLPKTFTVKKVGLGGGKRQYECPGFLRAMLIEETGTRESEMPAGPVRDSVYELVSNIDDCTGENLGYVMECLLAGGAKDVSYSPVFMKKNRPAYRLNVICGEEEVPALEEIIFRETTTIGIRRVKMERTILEREIKMMQTSLGPVKVKVCRLPGREKQLRLYPEYDSIVQLCRTHNLSFAQMYRRIVRECSEQR